MKIRFACLCLVAVLASASYAQNRCFNAIAIGDGLHVGSNVGADTTGSDPIGACGAMGSDVWYMYTASCNGTVTVATCAPGTANYDSVIAVFDAGCGCNGLVQIACNDDFCAGLRSQTTFNAVAGQNYAIAVGGFVGSQGNFTLSVSCAGGVPSHDECAGALSIPIGSRIFGTNVGSSNSAGIGCSSGNDVWYAFTAAVSGTTTVTTCNSLLGAGVTNYDTVLNVYDGTGGCGALAGIGCNDDNCATLQSLVSFNAVAGTTYYVSVGGFFGLTGRFALKVSQEAAVALNFWEQGPGTVGFRINDTGGNYYLFVTLNGTNYPNGWFFGLDMTWNDVVGQATAGFPFQGPMTGCGVSPVFGPLPSNLAIYGVAFGVPAIGGQPTAVSTPQTIITL